MGEDFGTNSPELIGVRIDVAKYIPIAISLRLSLCTITKRVEGCIEKRVKQCIPSVC